MAGELLTITNTGFTIYANILDTSSRRWNGSAFVVYSSGSYNLYSVTMSEDGTSGVYVGDFPVDITSPLEYQIIYYIQQGASPAEGDPVNGTGTVNWDGTDSVGSAPAVAGEMSGSDWETYVLRIFKRTDKQDELFDETNAAIAEIRRKFPTQRDEIERVLTDTISTLGEYRLDIESDTGLMVSDIFIRDSNDGYYLTPISKAEYDRRYSIWGTTSSDRDRPRHYALYGGQVFLGPVPDRTDYEYVESFSLANTTPVDADSVSIPYTTEDYKEILRFGTLWRLYAGLENDDQAGKWKAFWDDGLEQMERREKRNRRLTTVVAYFDC